jgi:hypothetical protein
MAKGNEDLRKELVFLSICAQKDVRDSKLGDDQE